MGAGKLSEEVMVMKTGKLDALRGSVGSAIAPVFNAFIKNSVVRKTAELMLPEGAEALDGHEMSVGRPTGPLQDLASELGASQMSQQMPAAPELAGVRLEADDPLAQPTTRRQPVAQQSKTKSKKRDSAKFTKAETYNLQAVAYYSIGRHSKALECAEYALKLDKENGSSWQLRGAALLGLKRHDESIKSYKRALVLEPDDFEAWIGYGQVLMQLDQPQRGAACFARALELVPNCYPAALQRARALAKAQQVEAANDGYALALQLNPDDIEAWRERGDLLLELERAAAALDCYDRVLKLNPSDINMLMRRGVVLRQLGRADDAVAAYDQALKIAPHQPALWYNKAIALESLGREAEAIRAYKTVLKHNPNDEAAWTALGQIYLRSFIDSLNHTDVANARTNWQEAMQCGRRGKSEDWHKEELQYLQSAASLGHHKLVKELIARNQGNELLGPLASAVEFLITKDQEKVTSLPTHIRRQVEGLIRLLRPLPA
jgi:tetratricopeptide (TPR) repeat protein